MREILALVEGGTISTPRAFLVMDAFVDRLQHALLASNEVAYLNAALQGSVYASEQAHKALREIGKRIDAEVREAEHIVEQTRDIENLKQVTQELQVLNLDESQRPQRIISGGDG